MAGEDKRTLAQKMGITRTVIRILVRIGYSAERGSDRPIFQKVLE